MILQMAAILSNRPSEKEPGQTKTRREQLDRLEHSQLNGCEITNLESRSSNLVFLFVLKR